jgi:hypothetical protein
MTSSSFLKSTGASIFVLAIVLSTTPSAFAQTPDQIANFCARLDTVSTNIQSRITNRESQVDGRKAERKTNFDSRISERIAKLNTYRETRDDMRADRYTKLESRATTDEQKVAVAEFEKDVEAAVAVRKTAVDAALASFRSSAGVLRTTTESNVDAAIDTFKAAIDTAFAKAESDCNSKVGAATIRTNLAADIKAAHETLKATRLSELASVKNQLVTLRATRKATIDAAFGTFRTSLSAATAELKAAFGN